jgi:hypothetical protein
MIEFQVSLLINRLGLNLDNTEDLYDVLRSVLVRNTLSKIPYEELPLYVNTSDEWELLVIQQRPKLGF